MGKKTYIIDKDKSPIENTLEVLKIVAPIDVSIEKMKNGNLIQGASRPIITIAGVEIFPGDKYKEPLSSVNQDNRNFVHIHFKTHLSTASRYIKRWSTKVEKDKIYLRCVKRNFETLRDMYKDDQKIANEKRAKEQFEHEEIKRVKNQSGISSIASIYKGYGNSFSLSLSGLTEDQVYLLSLHIKQIVGDRK